MAFEALEGAWLPYPAIYRAQVDPLSGRLPRQMYNYPGLSGTHSPDMS